MSGDTLALIERIIASENDKEKLLKLRNDINARLEVKLEKDIIILENDELNEEQINLLTRDLDSFLRNILPFSYTIRSRICMGIHMKLENNSQIYFGDLGKYIKVYYLLLVGREELLKMHKVGKKTADNIELALNVYGLSLNTKLTEEQLKILGYDEDKKSYSLK